MTNLIKCEKNYLLNLFILLQISSPHHCQIKIFYPCRAILDRNRSMLWPVLATLSSNRLYIDQAIYIFIRIRFIKGSLEVAIKIKWLIKIIISIVFIFLLIKLKAHKSHIKGILVRRFKLSFNLTRERW